jgi:DNA polymerase II small subunit
MKPELLIQKVAEAGACLSSEAFQLLQEMPEEEVERILELLSEELIITPEAISRLREGPKEEPLPEMPPRPLEPRPQAVTARLKVLKDITGQSNCRGELKDFVSLFRDRFQRLSAMLRNRPNLGSCIPLSALPRMEPGEEVRVVGMVSEKRETPKGHLVIELEDLTGRASVWAFKSGEVMAQAREVIPDEVIGVVGRLSERGGRLPSIFAREILWPEFPQREWKGAEEPVCAAFISDLHIGSQMFLEGLFRRFVSWLRGEGKEGERELAERVRYLFIAGDIVDGIGIYPSQEKELAIPDIFKQYEYAAELLSQIPERITVVICPGNHDAVRAAEPQPAIPKEVAGRFYELGYQMVGNPCTLEVEGVRVLMYHGRSFDDLATLLGMDRHKPTSMMRALLRRRHLSPFYGGKTALAPENPDLMVVEEPPDIFHCGHVHIFEQTIYRGVLLLNSGTFQAMTAYMRKQGINPTPGFVPVVDLQTGKLTVMQFA